MSALTWLSWRSRFLICWCQIINKGDEHLLEGPSFAPADPWSWSVLTACIYCREKEAKKHKQEIQVQSKHLCQREIVSLINNELTMMKNILIHAQLALMVSPWFDISRRPAKNSAYNKKTNKPKKLTQAS